MPSLVKEAIDGSAQTTIKSQAIVFHSLNIFALILVLVVLTTAMTARKIRRTRTWYTYLWIQLLLTLSFLWHPFKSSGYKPSFVTCLMQAVFVYTAPLTSSWAFLAPVVEVINDLSRLHFFPSNQLALRQERGTPSSAALCPHQGLCLRSYEGLRHPTYVGMQSDLSYCHFSSTTPAIIGAIIYLIPIVVCIPLFASIGFRAYRNSRFLERDHHILAIPLAGIIRMGILLFAPILGLGIAFPNNELEDLNRFLTLGTRLASSFYITHVQLFTLAPILTAIAFGSQQDLIPAAISLWGRPSTNKCMERFPSSPASK
ncbi:hypothetical protein BDN72DRAFT_900831 [Pluteus cervinus]|uniref:Uncharacterized protein n=1 Tax=Pluteus cervinus TaxID=181527 RepID=A0ACD3AI25_9AGAR|nr:hypothetical protein BDN72DRAFT_900831 [Pluteus cervinus]